MRYIYYDRRNINGTETQFFHESRTKATDKEFQTNMELDAQFPHDFAIKEIKVILPKGLVNSSSQQDTTLDDDIMTLIKEGVIQIQIGTGSVYYFPLSEALVGVGLRGDVEYTQASAGDGSYALIDLAKLKGLEVDLSVPARTDFKFFIKTKTSLTVNDVKVLLVGEIPT